MAEGQFLAARFWLQLQLDASQYLRGLAKAIARTEQFQQRSRHAPARLAREYRRGRPG